MYLLKMRGPQIWFCLFKFRYTTSKPSNNLITIDILGGAVETHPLWVQEVSGKGFYVWFDCLVVIIVFYS